jgi:hypothetical protein
MCGARYLGVQPLYICCVEVVVLVDVKPSDVAEISDETSTLNASLFGILDQRVVPMMRTDPTSK